MSDGGPMGDIVKTFWGNGIRKSITAIAGTIAAVAGAVVAVPPAWSALDLPEIASRRFVYDHVQAIINPMLQTESKLLIAQAQTTAALNQILLTQLQSSLYAAQKDMATAPSQTVQERIDALNRQIHDLQTNNGGGR
jgi:hypothetical protein